jgi:hypothetical protein
MDEICQKAEVETTDFHHDHHFLGRREVESKKQKSTEAKEGANKRSLPLVSQDMPLFYNNFLIMCPSHSFDNKETTSFRVLRISTYANEYEQQESLQLVATTGFSSGVFPSPSSAFLAASTVSSAGATSSPDISCCSNLCAMPLVTAALNQKTTAEITRFAPVERLHESGKVANQVSFPPNPTRTLLLQALLAKNRRTSP